MKKILSLFLLLMLPCMYVAAKLEGSGYYRIWNAAVLAKKKEKAFCCVTYNAYYMNTAAGTQQDIDAIPLYPEQYSFTDPAAIIYVQMPDATHKFDLMAQGVSVSKILDGSSLSLSGNTDGNYVLTGKVKGVDSPVYSTSYKTGFYGPRHYILTSANSDVSYKYWGADKVDSESATNYFGVKPTLSAKGKYYAPYYVSFPFEPASDGMKVYYVSKMTKGGYTLEEIQGIVPAATPVLIECSSDDPSKNRLRLHEPGTAGTAVVGNKLQGIYFCNPDLGIGLYKNCVTQFNPQTMRIWNVENGELVLSNNGSSLLEAEVAQGVKYVCLNANQSYLTVPADYSATMREGQLDPVTVTFLDDNGTVLKTVQGIPGENITLPDTPVKTGYSFAGWEGLNGVFPETNMTVKPVWAINQYTITFDVDGGEEVSPITQNYGTTVTAPASPVKEGHTFLCWEPTLPQTMPANNVTVKAKWQVNKYTVKFLSDKGEVIKETTQDYGSAIVLPEPPTKVGAEFVGWTPQPVATVPANDVTYTAVFEGTEYTITFDTDGAGDISPLKGFYGDAVKKPADPAKEGYTFLGWEPEIPATFSGSMTVKAKWQINKYTVRFLSDNGEVIKETTQDYGSAIVLPEPPTKVGAEFVGWTPQPVATVPANDVTYTAVFTGTEYTITFDTDGAGDISPLKGFYGDAVKKPVAPVKEGYTFLGWEPELPSTFTGNMTAKAKWQINQYTITFDTDGGSAVNPLKVDYNSAVTAPAAPTKEGHTFVGWTPELPKTMPANDITVKAQWKAVAYTITFDTDGGSAVAPITADYNTAITAPVSPVKEGYTFAGWQPALPATMPLNGLTVKAQWKANEYTITFDTDGGSAVSPITAGYNTSITAPAAPAKEGYTFLGWEPELPKTMPLNGLSVRAKWQVNQYTITFNTDGGSDVASVTGDYGTEVASPDAPVKYGYTFKGWNPELPTVIPGKNLTVKAQWEAVRQEHSVSVADGWNWISIPLMDEDMTDLNTLFANGTWALGDEIKTKTAIALYSEAKGSWLGALAHSKLSGTTMYKVRSAKQQDLSLKEGRMTVPSEMTVTVNSGWNYLSYLPAEPMLLAEALANYPAAEGDVIKTEKGSNVYSSTDGWKGELTALYPGQGYMLLRKGANAVTFRYPNEAQTPVEIDVAKTASRYADNMTVIATLTGVEPESGDSLVATVGGEVRGVSAVAEGGKTVLTVQGSGSERVSVALMRGGEVYATANTSLCYETDAVVGSLANPTAISFVEDDNAGKALAAGNVTAIYSSDGRRQNTTDLNTLAPGTYIVYAEADGMTNIIKTSIKR